MILSIKAFILTEQKRLSDLSALVNRFSQSSDAIVDRESYLGNPIHVFQLSKRMAIEWPSAEKLIRSDETLLKRINFLNQELVSRQEFSETLNGLLNLIKTYNLDVNALVDGVITYNISSDERKVYKKAQTNETFNAFDCYLMGKQSYDNNDFESAKQWLKIAIKRVDNETKDAMIADILRLSSYAYYRTESYEKAFEYMNLSMHIDPKTDSDHSKYMLYDLMSQLPEEDIEEDVEEVEEEVKEEVVVKVENTMDTGVDSMQIPELCRGERLLNKTIESQLKCFYLNTTRIPFLRIRHIKVEELFKRPQIVVIHDFLTDYEIQVMKNISQSKLRRTTVAEPDGEYKPSKQRVALGHFIGDNVDRAVARVSQRVSAITGLDTTYADALNVIKYGIGGFYAYHYDVYIPNLYRIATWINYLSDVEAGGATVFPLLKVTVWPKKGSALFWYNLYDSGVSDQHTLHAGCPVLLGSKWIATKWIYHSGHEFLKPCSLNSTEYHLLQNI